LKADRLCGHKRVNWLYPGTGGNPQAQSPTEKVIHPKESAKRAYSSGNSETEEIKQSFIETLVLKHTLALLKLDTWKENIYCSCSADV